MQIKDKFHANQRQKGDYTVSMMRHKLIQMVKNIDDYDGVKGDRKKKKNKKYWAILDGIILIIIC